MDFLYNSNTLNNSQYNDNASYILIYNNGHKVNFQKMGLVFWRLFLVTETKRKQYFNLSDANFYPQPKNFYPQPKIF